MFAAEGMWFIVAAVVFTFATGFAGIFTKRKLWFLASVFGIVVWVFFLVFFRDPVRVLPKRDTLVSPVDGTVLEVLPLPNGSTRISIFLSLFNVHAVRSPATGVVTAVAHHPGKFHPAYKPEAGRENEHVRVEIKTDDGPVVLYTMAGFVTRRVINHAQPGDSLLAGERIGFVRFGSRAEIMFPKGFVPSVQVDEKVTGGVTKLGRIDSVAVDSAATDSTAISLLQEGRGLTLRSKLALGLQRWTATRIPGLDRFTGREGYRRDS